ncbi:MAG: 3-oxoacyl-[acyl-carrier-protein] reductase [Promethearchaeota archaeon]
MEENELGPLAGKVAFVTGSTSGIGRAVALRFATDGADVVVHGRNQERAELVKGEIETAGRRAAVVLGDLSDPDVVDEVAKGALAAFGRVDLLVNNAGFGWVGSFTSMTRELVLRMVATNFTSVVLLTQRVVKKMRRNQVGPDGSRGRVVNVSSIGGKTAKANKVLYDSTKWALVGFTQGLAAELAPRKILVNAVCPGIIDTPIWGPQGASLRDVSEVPLRRFGTPEDVAEVVSFLVSPANTYMTGQAINVSGGREMH